MVNFDENAWRHIDALLPNQEEVKSLVLDDFIWFMQRPKKYKDDASKIHDYIHHLHLKRNKPHGLNQRDNDIFEKVNISSIESELMSVFCTFIKI